MDNQDLKYIKKHYGEKFAKLCRELFPEVLEYPGKLTEVITKYFDNIPTLYEDILPAKEEFRSFVLNSVDIANLYREVKTDKTPEQLLDEAGYYLFPECLTDKDLQSFKKYYAQGEELCSFRDSRLFTCHVWFAVKKELLNDIDAIKRGNPPQRQDDYGTSVISIQFTRGSQSHLSIKNRYNHAVQNPDNTFGNNLDNIVPGLMYAFCKYKGITLDDSTRGKSQLLSHLNSNKYISDENRKLCKTISSICCGWTCVNNKIIKSDGSVIKFDKSKYILFENYLISQEHKKIIDLGKIHFLSLPLVEQLLSDYSITQNDEQTNYYVTHEYKIFDTFVKSIGEIKSINVTHNENKDKIILITPTNGETVEIVINPNGQMVSYCNPNMIKVENSFLSDNHYLEHIDLPNATTIGDSFLYYNTGLKSLNLPKVESIGSCFLNHSANLKNVEFPNLKTIGDYGLMCSRLIENIDLPKLESAGIWFLHSNSKLKNINMPNIKKIGAGFITTHQNKKEIIKELKLDTEDIEKSDEISL